MESLTDKEIEDAVAPFAKGGKVRLQNLDQVFTKLNLGLTTDEINDVMKSNRFHEDDELTLVDFQSLVGRVGRAKLRERQLVSEFRRHDLDGDGLICRQEARAALEKEGVYLSQEDFDAIMKAVDLNGDGKVDYEEFARFASAR